MSGLITTRRWKNEGGEHRVCVSFSSGGGPEEAGIVDGIGSRDIGEGVCGEAEGSSRCDTSDPRSLEVVAIVRKRTQKESGLDPIAKIKGPDHEHGEQVEGNHKSYSDEEKVRLQQGRSERLDC